MSVSRAFSAYPPGSPVKDSPLQVPLRELPQVERRSTSRAPFIHLSNSLVNEPPSRFPSGARMECDALLQGLFYITFIRLSKSPVHEPTSRFPNGAPIEKMPITRAFLCTTFRVPIKEAPAPSRFHLQSADRERRSVSRPLLQLSLRSSR